jgi:hypothetical protein
MKHSPEVLRALLDRLCYRPSLADAARALGLGAPSTLFRWIDRSRKGDPAFIVHWPSLDDEPRQFCDLIIEARKRNIVSLEHQLRQDAHDGHDEVVIFEGAIQYKRDPGLIGKPWLVEMLGLPDDFLRDERGRVIPLTIRKPAPAALRVSAAKAYLANWQEQTHATLDINAKVASSLAVMRVPYIAPPPPPAPALPPHKPEELADNPNDSPLVRELKARARAAAAKPIIAGAPRVVVDPVTGARALVPVHVFGRDDDEPDDTGLSRPAADDPSSAAGVTPDGRPTTARGFRQA